MKGYPVLLQLLQYSRLGNVPPFWGNNNESVAQQMATPASYRYRESDPLRDFICGIKSRHTLLIADACFSGGIFKTREAFRDSSQAIQELYRLPSRKAITSGTLNEVPDKSVFVEYLLKRLRQNTSKYLSSEVLFSSIREAVINNSPINQVPQYGEIRAAGDEGGDFIFFRRGQKSDNN